MAHCMMEKSMVMITPETISALVQALESSDSLVRQNSGYMLLEAGPEAVPALIEAMRTPSRRMCWEAARLLARIDDPRWFEPMVEALATDNILLGQVAVKTLAGFGRRVTLALSAALDTSHPLVRPHIIEALGTLGDFRAIRPLMLLLYNERNTTCRYLAIEALTKLHALEAVELIKSFSDDENHHVRERVQIALKRLLDYPSSS